MRGAAAAPGAAAGGNEGGRVQVEIDRFLQEVRGTVGKPPAANVAEADDAFPAPAGRPAAIPESEQLMASEASVLPLLATCLAALVLATLLVISARQRWSAVLVCLLASPVVIALAWVTTDVLVRLLPNVM